MKNAISRYPLISFFVMAVLFSWIAVTPLLLNPELPLEPFQILGAFTPATQNATANFWIGESGILVAETLVLAALLLRRTWKPT